MTKALARHEAREARVIPIILSPTDIEGTPFEKTQALPKNAKPITKWTKREDAYFDVVETGQRKRTLQKPCREPGRRKRPHPSSTQPPSLQERHLASWWTFY